MGSDFNKDSKDVMYLVSKGSVGAEIGVWKANSSAAFLKRGVKELHLVDPWSVEPYQHSIGEHGSYENYLERYSKLTGGKTEEHFKAYYDKTYEQVVKRFKETPQVKIHRQTSDDWFKTFKGKLDWIYIDGDHSYEGCLRDLENAFKVVKKGGLILGDDYAWPFQKHGKAGVTKAVKEFVTTHSLHNDIRQEGPTSQFSIEKP